MYTNRFLKNLAALSFLFVASSSFAQEAKPQDVKADVKPQEAKSASQAESTKAELPGPSEVIQYFTDSLLEAVKEGGESIAEDPTEYYAQVQKVMEETVHFKYIAKGVMGKYAKTASKEEKIRFLKVFKGKLSETLAKAIANYADSKIEIEKEIADEKNSRKVYVSQTIAGPDGVIRVVYTMGQWKKVGWKISNLTLDSTNLGETYKSQFDQSVSLNDGDLNKAIDWWVNNG